MSRESPHSKDAERAVLGAVILQPQIAHWLDLATDDFYDPRHHHVWAAMRALAAADRPIDTVTLEEQLVSMERLTAIGGLSYLSELALAVPTADNVEHYAGILRARRVERGLLKALGDVHDIIKRQEGEGDELLAMALEILANVRPAERPRASTIDEILRREIERRVKLVERKAAGEDVYPGIPTGFSKTDTFIGGIPIGLLAILAGRPSHGKTETALQISENAAERGASVIYFGAEDGEESTALRIVAKRAGIDGEALRNLSLEAADWRAVMATVNAAASGPRWRWVDASGMSAEDVIRTGRALINQEDPKRERKWLVIVDYLQLLRWPTKADGEPTAISLNIRALGAFAKRDRVALLVLSQLNRDLERRQDKRPLMSDTKGSGEIEQHSRLILACYYEAMHVDLDGIQDPTQREAMARKLELIVLKNHDGRTNVRDHLYWNHAHHQIHDSEMDSVMQASFPMDDAPPPDDNDIPF